MCSHYIFHISIKTSKCDPLSHSHSWSTEHAHTWHPRSLFLNLVKWNHCNFQSEKCNYTIKFLLNLKHSKIDLYVWDIDFWFLLNQPKSNWIYYFPIDVERNSVWFQTNRTIVKTIRFRLIWPESEIDLAARCIRIPDQRNFNFFRGFSLSFKLCLGLSFLSLGFIFHVYQQKVSILKVLMLKS